MSTEKLYIDGIHCPACVRLIREEWLALDGIEEVSIDLNRKEATVTHRGDRLDLKTLGDRIADYGYKIVESLPQIQRGPAVIRHWLAPAGIAVLLIAGFLLLQNTGLLQTLSPDASDLSYPIALLTGVLASFSSCLAVVGSIVIAFGGLYRKQETTKNLISVLKPNLLFHLGRLSTFFVLGGLLGFIGGRFSLSGNLVGVLTMAVSLVLLLLGLNILGLVPSLSRLGIKMPSFLTAPIAGLKTSRFPGAPLILGFLTFFLPCGFTQSMQILALGSGSFMRGALVLLLFSAGTLPMLLIIGVSATYLRRKNWTLLLRTGGFLVVIFAVYSLFSAFSVVGFSGDVVNPSGAQNSEAGGGGISQAKNTGVSPAEMKESPVFQKAEMHVTAGGFEPRTIKIQKGVPVRWEIYGDQITGCTNALIIPALDVYIPLKPGLNIFEFQAEKAGLLPFSCWMGMVRGTFIVE